LTWVKTFPAHLEQGSRVTTNGNPATPARPKPVVYACSGGSDAGELADRIAAGLAAAKEMI
jgi:uncharacterized metal-binding protein